MTTSKENYCPLMYHENNIEMCMYNGDRCPYYKLDKNQCEQKRQVEIHLAIQKQHEEMKQMQFDFVNRMKGLEDDLDEM